MKKRTVIKIMACVFLPLIAYIWFNWPTISLGLREFNISTVIMVVAFISAIPFVWLAGSWLDAKLRLSLDRSIKGMVKTQNLPPEVRRNNARMFINELRKTDRILSSRLKSESTIIQTWLSPSRDDAVSWDMYAFTSSDNLKGHWNPRIGIDADDIPAEKVFYVIENAVTGECALRWFQNQEEAKMELNTIWKAGVKEVRASEFEREMLKGAAEQLGRDTAKTKEQAKEKEG